MTDSKDIDPQNEMEEKEQTTCGLQTERCKSPYTNHLLFTLVATVLGGHLQFGYNLGNVNTPEKVMKEFYNETYYSRNGENMPESQLNLLWAVTVSIFSIGAMLGCALMIILGAKYGRRTILLWNNVLGILSGVLMASSMSAHSYEVLIIGRTVGGITAGVASGTVSNYLSEISPVAVRGMCGVAAPFALVMGLLIGGVVGAKNILGTQTMWPILFALAAVPSIFGLFTLYWCPESPRYLMLTENDEQSATKALRWLRENDDVSDEIDAMRKEKEDMEKSPTFKLVDLWRVPEIRRPFVISIVLQLTLQINGINALTFYSTSIFEMANLSLKVSQMATIGFGVLNVLATALSGVLMDKAGRRTLQFMGLVGMCFSTTVLVICLVNEKSAHWLAYMSIVAVCVFTVFYAVGPGTVPWLIVAEMFEQGPRSAATSIAFIAQWLFVFLGAMLYPWLEQNIQLYSFLPYSGLLLFYAIFTYFFVPETKGKTILEITTMFKELTRNKRKDNETTKLL